MGKIDENGENLLLMNYGYENNERLHLDGIDEKYRRRIQLYHHIVKDIELQGKMILEIGCGRGGGIAYIARQFNPGYATGLDFSKSAINFANGYHCLDNLSFECGNAESLQLGSDWFDVVLNVESSHCYNSVETFFKEVYRVLKPGGTFLYSDFRRKEVTLLEELDRAGFVCVEKEDITPGVVRALELDHQHKITAIKNNSPRVLHGLLTRFGGTIGSDQYNRLKTGEYWYFKYLLMKKKTELIIHNLS